MKIKNIKQARERFLKISDQIDRLIDETEKELPEGVSLIVSPPQPIPPEQIPWGTKVPQGKYLAFTFMCDKSKTPENFLKDEDTQTDKNV